MEKELDKEYMGIPRKNIPELNEKYLEGLTDAQRNEIIKRWRLVKDFQDGTAVGRIIVDNLSVAAFNEFREISRKYFGNSDGPCLAALTQIFKIEKRKQQLLETQK